MQLLTNLPDYFPNCNSWSNNTKNVVKIDWHIPSKFFLYHLFFLDAIVLTVLNTICAVFCDLHVGQINLGTLGTALTSPWFGLSRSSMPLPRSMSDSLSASLLSLIWFESSKFQFQSSQFSVFKMVSGALSTSRLGGWRSIVLIWWTFITWVCPLVRLFADNAGGKGDLSVNLDAASSLCSKLNQEALIISSVSAMYPMALFCLVWALDSICIVCCFWLPCHISKLLSTLVIICNVLSSGSRIISKSFYVFIISNAVWLAAKGPVIG